MEIGKTIRHVSPKTVPVLPEEPSFPKTQPEPKPATPTPERVPEPARREAVPA